MKRILLFLLAATLTAQAIEERLLLEDRYRRDVPNAILDWPRPRPFKIEWIRAPVECKALKPIITLEIIGPINFSGEQTVKQGSADGWRPLFNGKDLDGWTPIGSAVWRVGEGVIAGGQDGDPKKSGLLATKEKFQDFELELEFIIDEHGKYNSGVYLRNDTGTAARTGYQVNIGRGIAGEYVGLFTTQWLSKGDETDTIRKKLEWNKLRILAKGGHIAVDLNGTNIVDYTDPNPTEKLLQKGVIGFQTYGAEGHAGWVKFKNIRIRELK